MIQCNSFELVYLRKIPYLIPYGQQTANLQKSVRLNETGVLIWNGLSQKKPLDQILQDILNTYELSESDRPFVQEDLYETIAQLESLHVITNSDESDPKSDLTKKRTNDKEKYFSFCIGPLTIRCEGQNISPLSIFFKDFLYPDQNQKIMQHIIIKDRKPETIHNSSVLVSRADILIKETSYCYCICLPDQTDFYEMRIAKDASFVGNLLRSYHRAGIFISYNTLSCFTACTDKEMFFPTFCFHSFSRKSMACSPAVPVQAINTYQTLAYFLDAPYLNGDLNMIGMKNDHYIVYGQPWCGTSKIYTTADHPLGGIVFLKQSDKNHWQSLTSDQKVLQLLYRLISPSWTKDMLHKNMHFSKMLSRKVPLFSLECTATKEACYTAKDGILFYQKNPIRE